VLPTTVADEKGGTVTLGHVEVVLPPGALQFETRFFISPVLGPTYAEIPPVEAFAIRAVGVPTQGDVTGFGVPARLIVHTEGLDLSGIVSSTLRIAALGQDGAWRTLPTSRTTDPETAEVASLSAQIDAPGTYGVVGKPSAPRVDVTITSDAPDGGRHRVEPGATVHVTITARPDGRMTTGTLGATIPSDWTLDDADGAIVDPRSGSLSWDLGTVEAGAAVARRLTLTAPAIAADAKRYESTGTFTARVTQRRSPSYRAEPHEILVAPKFVVAHKVVGVIDRKTRALEYKAQDTDLGMAKRFTVIRLRFRVENPDSVPVTITPLIQYHDAPAAAKAGPSLLPLPGFGGLALPGADAGAQWVALPGFGVERGEARFYVAPEARDKTKEVDGIDGSETKTQDDDAAQAGTGLQAAAQGKTKGPFTRGVHSKGENPAPSVTIPADGWTEVEFSVRATGWADFSTEYDLRLTDGGNAIEPSVVATVPIEPNPDAGTVGSADTLPGGLALAAAPAGVTYPLVASGGSSGVTSAALRAAGLSAAAGPSPHGDLSMTTDSCAACHRTHTGQTAYLTATALPQSQTCFVCHNGLGASSDIAARYATATANVPGTASYYQHPATAPNSGHTNALNTEFAGVLDRHTECSDCHNPHNPTQTPTLAASTGAGWRVSGAVANASGVRVTNGPAGSAPAYGWLGTRPGDEAGDSFPAPVGRIAFEYELCLKCHSGYTTLLATTGVPMASHPSWWALDKGVEANPANKGVHPIQGVGSNTTTQMGNSLSPLPGANTTFRTWSLKVTDTLRCTMCHGDPAQTPAGPAASSGIRLDAHVSPNRGILRAPYRDRSLKFTGEDYVQTDFSLCFMCHAVEPFTAGTGGRTDTNFNYHGFHMSDITNEGSNFNRDIDTPGAGSGNAICSECHFRTHANVFRVGTYQAPAGGYVADRLVNFSPNVIGALGNIRWQRRATGAGGNCTLTCHGVSHVNEGY
jgi:predicted CXXCH cytochrome family protein